MSKRSEQVIVTSEARALRELRKRSGMSMRLAGEKLGYSSSYISQIENGRENVPKGKRLDKFLEVYAVNRTSFTKLVNGDLKTDLELILELVPKLEMNSQKVVRTLVEQLLTS
ncbi:MAG: helix-turn-helix domain-containing protein [Bdellovibrionaceae bacterium]|jgi:HTH-type transcriptional regulator, competence development regulator|nr:helix-turn-helix domain-containing protein [Pseudobdellovibrionaceae bacterium]